MKKELAKHRKLHRDNIWGWALASPPIIGFILFGLLPLFFSLYMSFCSTKGFLVENMNFLGWDNLFGNYKEVLSDPLFYKAIGNTFYSLLSLPITMILSLIISWLLTSEKIRFRKVFRVIFFLPYVCSIVSLTTMWRTAILDKNYGILNGLLNLFGIDSVAWLTDPNAFMPAMIIMNVWMGLGYQVILFSAALTSVNKSVYEAAAIDGAGKVRTFFHMTLPLISPTIFYVMITGLIGGLQEFTRFQAINNVASNLISPTGPNDAGLTIVFYLYNKGFGTATGMGIAAATSWLLCIIIGVITLVNFKISNRWVNYD